MSANPSGSKEQQAAAPPAPGNDKNGPRASGHAPGEDEVLPTWDAVPADPARAIPVALPVPADAEFTDEIPLALPVDPAATIPPPAASGDELPVLETAETPAPSVPINCRVCGSPRVNGHASCADCGYYFTEADLAPAGSPAPPPPAVRVRGRYQLGALLCRRGNASRYLATDQGAEGGPVPVVVLAEPAPPKPAEVPGSEASSGELEIVPASERDVSSFSTAVLRIEPMGTGLPRERAILRAVELPALPIVLDEFTEDGIDYMIEECPAGRPLWDAWDDPATSNEERFGWLIEVARALQDLHRHGAFFEGLRPDNFVITDEGRTRFRHLTDLLPLPLPPDTPLRGSLYAAPEMLTGRADARSDLYGFGALLYALHVGRELDESDFDHPGHPKPFVPRFPDVHPAFGRLVSKTFRREIEARFPTDEAVREDPTGFQELIRTLKVLQRTLAHVRLEIAAWTTTGMVRTGNEDAFALLHACESRQDDLGESALVLLADGMGGYEAGEVAAALAIQVMRQELVSQGGIFAPLAGTSHFPGETLSMANRAEGHAPKPLDVPTCKHLLRAALREANRQVHAAARAPGSRRRGMGCTAEAVYVDGRHVVVGHVGDSRTYHLHEGRLIQMTRDQTLVNRLVELGTLTEEEAEHHPRRNELQQAIGGQPDVEPALYSSLLTPGDWVVVCSDGLSNHVGPGDLKQMLLSEAQSAEIAARRLVNLANIEGATDNATVVVIRAT
jgi:serine/threonine protein phosphatase PrpC